MLLSLAGDAEHPCGGSVDMARRSLCSRRTAEGAFAIDERHSHTCCRLLDAPSVAVGATSYWLSGQAATSQNATEHARRQCEVVGREL